MLEIAGGIVLGGLALLVVLRLGVGGIFALVSMGFALLCVAFLGWALLR